MVGRRGLVTINPVTGEITGVGGGVQNVQSLAFAPDGTLYAARDLLYKVDLNNGGLAQVGSRGLGDIRGIGYIVAVPEPDTFIVFALGGLAVLGLQWVRAWRAPYRDILSK
jgi:hypothetical protein